MKEHIFNLLKPLMLAVITSLVCAGTVNAAPDGKGGGQGGGGQDGGTTPDLGDLVILYRDANGIPIATIAEQVTDPETGLQTDGGLCQQPLAFNVSDQTDSLCPTSCVREDIENIAVIKVDPYTCAVQVGCSTCTQEVDFGRTNVVRSPAAVFEAQLEDVRVNLSTADCVTLDPAGRLVGSTVDPISGAVLSSAIDSPLQNLAIYRQLMLTGSIGVGLPEGADLLNTAARSIGTGSGKSGEVNVDQVVYINQILGLTETQGTLDKLSADYREEVQGTIQLVTKTFLNYGSYGYARENNFSTNAPSLPRPAYIPGHSPTNGWFEYLGLVEGSVAPDFTFNIKRGPILDAVFCDDLDGNGVCNEGETDIKAGFTEGNIGGFAQAADDTRAVINFMHNWPLPLGYTTAIQCEPKPPGDITYDLSISDDSGLQVPVRMIDGMEEGREFSVTVSNAGPDIASGSVTVTANIQGTSDPLINFKEYFENLAAGTSVTFYGVIRTDIGYSTTISWTAIVDGDDDVNESNNSTDATTTVKVTGGK